MGWNSSSAAELNPRPVVQVGQVGQVACPSKAWGVGVASPEWEACLAEEDHSISPQAVEVEDSISATHRAYSQSFSGKGVLEAVTTTIFSLNSLVVGDLEVRHLAMIHTADLRGGESDHRK